MISFVSFQSIDPSFSITQGAPGKLSVPGGMDHGTSVALKRAAGIRIDASFRLTHAWIECCNLAPEVKENVLAVTELLSPHEFLQIVGVTLGARSVKTIRFLQLLFEPYIFEHITKVLNLIIFAF